jgi:hypothetical protein
VESVTWSLVSSRNSGDLYLGAREVMRDLKVSLHESGITRMAWTSAAAEARVVPGADRVIARWDASDPLPNGWRVSLRLTIPDSALCVILLPLEGTKSKPIVALPPAGPGRVVDVRMLLGDPGCGGIRVEGDIEEVGRMLLGDGTKVPVVAWSCAMSAGVEQQLAKVRALACAEASDRPVPRASAWARGTEDGTGIPYVLDAGDPRPPEDRPTIIPGYDGPPEVCVGELAPEAMRGNEGVGSEILRGAHDASGVSVLGRLLWVGVVAGLLIGVRPTRRRPRPGDLTKYHQRAPRFRAARTPSRTASRIAQ